MKVVDLIHFLLEIPMDAEIRVVKELDYNVYVNSELYHKDLEYSSANRTLCIGFNFPVEKFNITRKERG